MTFRSESQDRKIESRNIEPENTGLSNGMVCREFSVRFSVFSGLCGHIAVFEAISSNGKSTGNSKYAASRAFSGQVFHSDAETGKTRCTILGHLVAYKHKKTAFFEA